MPNCLITIRPSQNDYVLLEDYIILFKSWLEKYKHVSRYAWSVEEDQTINRHLHCYLEHSENKGSGKIKEQLKTTIFKTFIKSLPHTTIADIMINVINAEDPKYYLGYASKDHTCRHESTIPDDEIISSLKYYYTTEKYKTRVLEKAKSNWKHVTSRNFHVCVEDYLQKNPELSLEDSHELILSMKSNFHTFQLPIRDNDKFFKELKLSYGVATQSEKYSASLEAQGQTEELDTCNIEDIKQLLHFIWTNTRLCGACCVLQELALKQNKIMHIFKKHQHLFDLPWLGDKSKAETKYEGLCITPKKA